MAKRSVVPLALSDELVTRGNREVVRSVAANNGAHISDFGFFHMIRRSEDDSILAESLGLRKEIPRQMFHQLIAKASDDVKRKLERERPELVEQIQNSVTDVAGALHSKFGPASKDYFTAKKAVTNQLHYGNLNEKSILECARGHRIEEATVGMSLLCSLPVEMVERALRDTGGELTLILAKALDFEWETAMALLFLGARDHRISSWPPRGHERAVSTAQHRYLSEHSSALSVPQDPGRTRPTPITSTACTIMRSPWPQWARPGGRAADACRNDGTGRHFRFTRRMCRPPP